MTPEIPTYNLEKDPRFNLRTSAERHAEAWRSTKCGLLAASVWSGVIVLPLLILAALLAWMAWVTMSILF